MWILKGMKWLVFGSVAGEGFRVAKCGSVAGERDGRGGVKIIAISSHLHAIITNRQYDVKWNYGGCAFCVGRLPGSKTLVVSPGSIVNEFQPSLRDWRFAKPWFPSDESLGYLHAVPWGRFGLMQGISGTRQQGPQPISRRFFRDPGTPGC